MLDAILGEVITTCEKIHWLCNEGERWLRPEARSPGILSFYKSARVEYHPVGVVGGGGVLCVEGESLEAALGSGCQFPQKLQRRACFGCVLSVYSGAHFLKCIRASPTGAWLPERVPCRLLASMPERPPLSLAAGGRHRSLELPLPQRD